MLGVFCTVDVKIGISYLCLFVGTGNILAFGQGTNIGWYSPALPVINTVPSPLLDGPISQQTAGWIGSFLAIGGVCGGLGFGFLANWIGYKRSLQLSAIPIFVRNCIDLTIFEPF